MNWLLILGFTLSSSLDNLGVGLSYGIRKIQINVLSNVLIAIVCFLFSYTGIWFGKWLAVIIPGVLPERIGALFLLIIGVRIIYLAFPSKERKLENTKQNKRGITTILQNPESADLDQSNDIGTIEALILGIALSVNALTSGLSAGLLGLSPMLLSLAAAAGSFITVWLGVWMGGKVAEVRIGSFSVGPFGTVLSGIILLLIAANNLL